MAVRVAPLTAADAAAYRAFMLEAYAEAEDAFTATVEERAAQPEAWWARRAADPAGGSAAFGAFDGDRLVGAVAVEFSPRPKTRHTATLVGLYVRPSHRGRGVAGALVDAVIERCAAHGGIRSLKLTVTEGNDAAIRRYRARGFREYGVEPLAARTAAGFRGNVHRWRPGPAAGEAALARAQSLAFVSLLVPDYDEALAFYVGVLGFTLVEDRPVPEQAKRWVVVRPPGGGGCAVVLARPSNDAQRARVGSQAGDRVFLFLHTDDFARDHAAYAGRGVEFVRPPQDMPYGRVAVFRDPWGNRWDLVGPAP